MATKTERSVTEICAAAKKAARSLARASDEQKDAVLLASAAAIEGKTKEILAANKLDIKSAEEEGLDSAFIDRLTLTEERVKEMAQGLRDIEALPDPVGEILEGQRLKNGLHINKIRVPLGVVAIIYEARPNVTVDAAGLCLKSGNAVVLRGSSAATNSNRLLGSILQDVLANSELPVESLGLLLGGERSELEELTTAEGLVDLIVPRGGEGLKAAIKEVATVPVIYAAAGNCHVYVDADADIEQALAITVDAKTDRPGTCNSAETLLVHEEIAPQFLPKVLSALSVEGVELRTDAKTQALAGNTMAGLVAATEADWQSEFLSLTLAVRVVASLEEAVEHIGRYGSGHSEAIVTNSVEAAEEFSESIDAACVYVNASTRFTDGGVFGMGAEIGNSTQKLHARGPVGIHELTTYKYVVQGTGQTRGAR